MVDRIRYPGIARTMLIGAIAVLGGCSMFQRAEPVVDRSRDSAILRAVQEALASEPSIEATRIRVEVDAAIVMLYGSVDGIGAWQCALRNAQMVDGVLTVVDYLVIARGPREVPCSPTSITSGNGPHPAPEPSARERLAR